MKCLYEEETDMRYTLENENLKVEIHLYRYGDLAHFWVKGYEYLRQLEYRIAILHTKCEYLGADAASEEERKLSELVHFPPLNYACYRQSQRNISCQWRMCGSRRNRPFQSWKNCHRKPEITACFGGWHFIGSIMEKQ